MPQADGGPTGPTIIADSTGAFELKGLTKATADAEAKFFRDSGTAVKVIAEADGTFTVQVGGSAPQPPSQSQPPLQPQPPGPVASNAPDLDGYVICLDRIRSERRPGMAFDRTVSSYQAYFNKTPVADIFGMAVERQGPGDNSQIGVDQHRCIAAGTYPLFTHAGDNIKYRTIGYLAPPSFPNWPWPCIGIEDTGNRSGVLIHCASGYLMSIGCINLTGDVANAQTNLVFNDSWARVAALVASIKNHLGAAFPASNNQPMSNVHLAIREQQ